MVAYPQSHHDEAEAKLNLWNEMFLDESYEIVQLSVKAFISSDTKGFPPSIGNIKQKIVNITESAEMTELEAWECIRKAASNGYYGCREEWEKLPSILKSLTSPSQIREWAMMDSEVFNSVVASNFMRSYRVRAKHHYEYSVLPNNMKSVIDVISEKLKMIEG